MRWSDANIKRLMTMPGIDMVVVIGLAAAIGPVERFKGTVVHGPAE